jgi:DNA-binding transcriptional regulator YhcF (GntR family)
MQIRIDKRSDVPVREQVREQIIYLIATGQLPVGSVLPSVRELARRLKIHHNTVSQAYSLLAERGWLIQRRGSKLVVSPGAARSELKDFSDLDDLIDRAIRFARSRGYSLQDLTARVRLRLAAQPADHFLVVAPERELGEIMRSELAAAVGHSPNVYSVGTLRQNPSVVDGAAILTPSYWIAKLDGLVPADRLVSVNFSAADEHLALLRGLSQASAIAVVSVSGVFLETASGLFAPAIGRRHTFRVFHMTAERKLVDYMPGATPRPSPIDWPPDKEDQPPPRPPKGGRAARPETGDNAELSGFDVVFCDSIAYQSIQHRRKVQYRLLSDESLAQIRSALL